MATTTTNFGWDIPQSTDLVKDGATAIAALGQDIDTALVDLKGGTTGQVLAKATNTDLDFTWVAQDDSNAIQNAIVDAKGDLIAATGADTPARLAVGTNGQVLTADSTTATGLAWATSSSGGQTLISTTTLSAATAISLTSIPTTYKHLRLVFIDCVQSASDVFFVATFNNDTTAKYAAVMSTIRSDNTVKGGAQNVGTSIGVDKYLAPIATTFTGSNNGTMNGYFDIYNYASTTLKRSFSFMYSGYSLTDNTYHNGSGNGNYHTTGTAITRVDFTRSASQSITGTLQLWGIS